MLSRISCRALAGCTVRSRVGTQYLVPAIRSPVSASATTLNNLSSRKMSSARGGESTLRPEPDKVLQDIADYVHNYKIDSDLAFETARLCLIDTIGCGLEGLRFPECKRLLGPVVEGTIVPNGGYHRSAFGSSFTFNRYQGSRHQLSIGSYPWCFQYRHHHPLARFQ